MVCKLGQKKSAATTLTAPNSSNKPDSYEKKRHLAFSRDIILYLFTMIIIVTGRHNVEQ